ncbi:hypothetical protein [Methylophaga sp. OBS4]|uniref:hypothetical protein n=1 Tax=Methylophaga sp. OBS4 TaxID=2991935 RepID=UPI0022505105|nr:hypothetical protein [Methylophaga sp. OBS4]MCX4188594.1 hypothetical protein [Methylophaga sp. OBS4]
MLNRKPPILPIFSSMLLSFSLILTAPTILAEDSSAVRFGTSDSGSGHARKFGGSSDSHTRGRQYHRHDTHRGDHGKYQSSGSKSERAFGLPSRHDSKHSYHSRDYDRKFDGFSDNQIQGKQYHQQTNTYRGSHNRHQYYGIKGHRSFGMAPRHDSKHRYHSRDHDRNIYRSPHHYKPRYYSYYRHTGIYLNYSPIGYSYYSRPVTTTIVGYPRTVGYRPAPIQRDDYSQIDAWAALGNYQIDAALNAFEGQINSRPDSALPRVGYALAIALSGDIETGALAMEQALSSDVTDLHYFRADTDLELIIEELLLSYQDDPLMTASLYYLQQDYIAANKSISYALRECSDCPSVRNLQGLIKRRI